MNYVKSYKFFLSIIGMAPYVLQSVLMLYKQYKQNSV